MILAELDDHLQGLGLKTEVLTGGDDRKYLVICNLQIAGGTLHGKSCDVAILCSGDNPWVPEAALHVRPILVAMGSLNTQLSPVGPDWQYWSRRFDKPPMPRTFLAHIQTVLGEV